jgi:small subunit ribosomal protein S1
VQVNPDATTGGATKAASNVDLSSLSSMLRARWKGNVPAIASKPEPLRVGQLRSFRILKLNPETKLIEVEVA